MTGFFKKEIDIHLRDNARCVHCPRKIGLA